MPRIAKQAALRTAAQVEQDEVDCSPIKRVYTSAAVAGVHKPAGAMNSPFDVVRPPKPAASKRTRAPLFNPATIAVEPGVPLPPHGREQIAIAYAALLDRMKPGDSVVLAPAPAAGLRTVGAKRGLKMVTRAIAGGDMRVWLLEGNGTRRTTPKGGQ